MVLNGINSFLNACIDAATAGGRAVVGTSAGMIQPKQDPHVGHHAIVSTADFQSQYAIVDALRRFDRHVQCIVEETVSPDLQAHVLRASDVTRLDQEGAFVVDELDGSSSFAAGHYEWSVSIGYVERLMHVAAAVYAPDVLGGALFIASRGQGAFMQSSDGHRNALRVAQAGLGDAYVLIGPDMLLRHYPLQNKLAIAIADRCRTININGSCALAMSLVAAGRANVVIQPPQSPWDWAAGRLLVEEAGGVVLFYEQREDAIVPVASLAAHHYDPASRAVGLVAGEAVLAREIMACLQSLCA